MNEPLTDFTKEENARKMRAAIEKVRGQLGREYDLIIGGKRIRTADKIKSINPGKAFAARGSAPESRKRARGTCHAGRARSAFADWSQTSVEERASLLFRVGDVLRERKFEFCAWLVFEVSKNWAEADADIAETIDFCRVLRSRSAAPGPDRTAGADAGRARHSALHSAGRGRGDSAVEFSLRHHGGHDAWPPS